MIFTKFIFLLHSHVNYVEVAFLISLAIEKVSYLNIFTRKVKILWMSVFFRVVCMMNRRRTYSRSFEIFFSELQGKKSFFRNVKEKLFGKRLEECTSGLTHGGGRYKLCQYLTVQTHICFVEPEKYHLLPFVIKSSRKD